MRNLEKKKKLEILYGDGSTEYDMDQSMNQENSKDPSLQLERGIRVEEADKYYDKDFEWDSNIIEDDSEDKETSLNKMLAPPPQKNVEKANSGK